MSSVFGKSYKGLLAEYGEPVHGYNRSLNKEEARWRLSLFKMHQENRSTLVRGQILGNLQKLQCLFMGVPDKLLEAELLTQREEQKHCQWRRQRFLKHLMLKFRDEDTEAVMTKVLEEGSDSEGEQALFPGPTPVPEMEMKLESQVEKKPQVRSIKFSLQMRFMNHYDLIGVFVVCQKQVSRHASSQGEPLFWLPLNLLCAAFLMVAELIQLLSGDALESCWAIVTQHACCRRAGCNESQVPLAPTRQADYLGFIG